MPTKQHPEIRKGEMFISNIYQSTLVYDWYNEISWKTKRKGAIAYKRDGTIIKDAYPVFIQAEEYESMYNKKVDKK